MTETVEAGGARIPLLGLGTWDLRGKSCARMVDEALRLGYRHIDTAAMYRNEEEVGEGLRASGVRRDDVFITTKVWSSDLRARDFERSAHDSLKNLKLDSVDLLLIHWPNASIPLKETIGALCKMKREGVARHIGVSNFDAALIAEAVKLSTEPLINNQIELHPFLDQSRTIAASRKASLSVTAYSPVARGKVMSNAVLARIAKTHGKSPAQVSLRYLVQQSIIVIPKTSRVERLKENAAIFDFRLTPAEMKEIAALASPHGRIVS
ncbi:aldo/keto reductase [Pseudorhodoplanes sp.]|jgi:diketogulonate reductase-like aldo/keto reductase|uniref:aldo/keto reductase n=1 Tax=Pseudorhodoplanes sp. TaxID=1934341 RepID=UPI002C69A2A8|nr:aldo/keto reductase [Pseudorhodoplanes sp.]HWV41153.1 aldo/keto reductase [Pseudorhodoplanes sp.]